MYEVCLLYEAVSGNASDKNEHLVRFLQSHQGDLTRADVDAEKKRLKRNPPVQVREGVSPQVSGARVSAPNSIEPQGSDRLIDLLLLTPGAEDIRRLRQDYADPSDLSRRINLQGIVAEAAVGLVLTTIRELPTVATRLLPNSGLPRIAKILLLRHPDGPDVSDKYILVLAQSTKASGEKFVAADWSWLSEDETVDPTAIAERLVPNAASRMHVFAAYVSEGWQCRVGADSWAEEPSVS